MSSPRTSTSSDDDDFIAFGRDLIEQKTPKISSTTSIDLDGLLATPLKLHEDLANGCGGMLWPAGVVLAKYMLRNRREGMRGKTIVEIGAGGGLVGLAIALGAPAAFAVPLQITDQLTMLPLMHINIALNDLESTVQPSVYDWGSPPPAHLPSHPNIILAADCVYFEPAFPLLKQTLLDLIGEDTVCYFCFKKRRRADMHFIKGIKKVFDVREVMDDVDKLVYERENIHLLEIRKKKANTAASRRGSGATTSAVSTG